MKRKFKKWLSTIQLVSTKWTPTSYLKSLNTKIFKIFCHTYQVCVSLMQKKMKMNTLTIALDCSLPLYLIVLKFCHCHQIKQWEVFNLNLYCRSSKEVRIQWRQSKKTFWWEKSDSKFNQSYLSLVDFLLKLW